MKKVNYIKAAIVLASVIILALATGCPTPESTSLYLIPFGENNDLAHLDGESTLKFTSEDELPVLDGATALMPVYYSFVENVYPNIENITDYYDVYTTAYAYEHLIERTADIIFVAAPSQDEIEKAKEAGYEFELYPIGYEAFVFLVNVENPVNSLTIDQIRQIYTGKITNWKSVGGKNRTIKTYQREPNSGSQSAFIRLMGDDMEFVDPETEIVLGMEGLVKVVAEYDNSERSIGYSFRYYVETMQHNDKIKLLSINGIAPTKENIKNKTYPITSNFYAVTLKGTESENTKRLINWIQGPQGQELVEKTGYVGIN